MCILAPSNEYTGKFKYFKCIGLARIKRSEDLKLSNYSKIK